VGRDLDAAAVGSEPDPEIHVEDEPAPGRGRDPLVDFLGADRRAGGQEPEEREPDPDAPQRPSFPTAPAA
jgi:hypothetical protein